MDIDVSDVQHRMAHSITGCTLVADYVIRALRFANIHCE